MSDYVVSRFRDFDINQAFPNDPDFDAQSNKSDRYPETVRLTNGELLALWRVPLNEDLDPDRPPSTGLQRFDAGGNPVGDPILIPGTVFTAVAALPDGGFVIANGSTWARFAADGSQVGGYGEVGTLATRGYDTIDIDSLADGGWVISWTRRQGPDDHDLFAQSFSVAGVPGAVITLNPGPAETPTETSVSGLADGTFAVTWVDGDWGDNRELRLWRNGVETVIDSAATIEDGEVAQLPDGRLIVTWAKHGAQAHHDIFAAFVGIDGTVSAPFFVGHADFDLNPRVDVFANGRFVIAWAASGEGFVRVFGQVFDPVGLPLDGGRFHVDVAPSQEDFSITALSDTNFAVAWAPYGTSDRTMNGALFTIVSGQSFVGTPADDSFNGTIADDTMYGLDGNDRLEGRQGDDRMEGGAGDDTYFVDADGDVVIELPGEGRDIVYAHASYRLTAGSHVEVLSTVGHGAVTMINLTGNELSNHLIGNAGSNRLDGRQGIDTLQGLGGNDTYFVDTGDIVIETAGGGRDTVYAFTSYVLTAGAHVEYLSTVSHGATTPINLTGNNLNNTLIGNAGANVLHGGGGNDTLQGLGGDDTYYVSGDLVIEDAVGGTDTVYAMTSYALGANVYVEVLSTVSHAATTAINLTGNDFDQTLVGNAGPNRLHGGGGIDVLIGLAGDDVYYTDVAATRVEESEGGGSDQLYTSVSYTLASGVAIELLSASSHAASTAIDLTGNGFTQTLAGNSGQNFLDGKGGADTLYGFAGADRFAFTTPLGGGNVDRIADFQSTVDTIALDDAIFAGLATGALPASAFVIGGTAQDANDRILYDPQTGALLFDADGNGSVAAIQFASLPVLTDVNYGDFLVI